MMSKQLRVALLSFKGAGPHYGGPGTNAWRMYAGAEPGLFNVTLLHGWKEQSDAVGVWDEVVQIGTFGSQPASQARWMAQASKWLYRHSSEFDVVHGLTAYMPCMIPAVVAAKRGLPGVVKVAGNRADLAPSVDSIGIFQLARLRHKLINRYGIDIVCTSREILQECLSYGIRQELLHKIPNAVDVQKFGDPALPGPEEARLSLGLPNRYTILFVGGIVRRKRPDLIISALRDVVDRGIDAQLVLAGPTDHDTKYAAELDALGEQLGLSTRIIKLGMVSNMPLVYRAATVFCLPSLAEGMANAMLEAMSGAIPVIVCAASGVADVVTDTHSGRIVGQKAGDIASAIADYAGDPQLAHLLAINGRKSVTEKCSIPSVMSSYHELFVSAVRRGGA